MKQKIGINRREFLTTSSLAVAGTVLTSGMSAINYAGGIAQGGVPAGSELEPWYDRTKRWIQFVFTEGDTGKYDPQWWLDLFKRAHVQGICVVAGGVTAFYPTKIQYHPIAQYMKEGQDMFGDIVRPAQKMGITIVARTDAQACLNEAAAKHPEWLNIDENGSPRKHKSFLDTRTVTCAYGDYNFKYMTGIHKEIMKMYMVDGLFCNRWQGWARGMCYCPTCQKLFREFSGGMELPRKHSQKDILLKYYEWETERLTELWHLWDGEIRKINPKARYFTNVGIDIDRAAELSPLFISETQSRGQNYPWHVGEQGKQTQAIFEKKNILAMVGMTLGSRHSVVPEAELKMWLLGAVTNGFSPWLIKSSATNWDNRWIPALEKVFIWHYNNEKYMKNVENMAKVAILFRKGNPRNPLLGTGASTSVGGDRDIDPEGRVQNPVIPSNDGRAAKGMYQILIESRIPFNWAYNGKMDVENLDKYKVLILPNAYNLTDIECENIRQFVNRGGGLIATYQTSLHNGEKERENFGLSDIFGVTYTGKTGNNGSNGYIRLEHETKHPILKGLEDTQQVISPRQYVNVKANAAFPVVPLTRIPTYPTDPMEQIYPRIPKTDIPEVYLQTIGRGRVVYFPNDIDSTFSENMAPDFVTLIRNAVEWAMNNEPQPATVTGPGILEVTCFRQEDSMAVHLLNCTNSFMLRSAYREDIQLGSQLLTINIPENSSVKNVRLLVADEKANYHKLNDNKLIVTVPKIIDHEVVAVDFNEKIETWTSLFNGKDLSGWTIVCQPQDKDKLFWTVADGTILCNSTGMKGHNHVWLVSNREYSDFEIRLKFQAYSDCGGNSGLQFRSRYDTTLQNGGWMNGPQVDINPPEWSKNWRTGLIYDETNEVRHWIYPKLPDWNMTDEYKPKEFIFKYVEDGDGWNELVLICDGMHIKTILNGIVCTDWDASGVLDDEIHQKYQVGQAGHIALQLHHGDDLRIRFKDIKIREIKK